MRKLITILKKAGAAVLVFACLLTACTTQESNKQDASVLVYGSNDYTSINPALYEHGEINSLIFSGLTAHDKDNRIIPALAEEWSFDRETCSYTFHLRDDVTWHDGEPFTAEDVKFTLESIMNPDNMSEIASNYEDIISITLPDKDTVVIKLKAPNVAMLDYLTIGILPKHLLEGKDLTSDTFNQKPIGTGPYKLVQWDQGQSITLKKNEDYYGGEPRIDTVIFKIVKDEKARAMQLQSGELDFAQITPQDAELFKSKKDFQVYEMDTADYRGIMYNFNHSLFEKNRELPNALSYAIDRQTIVDAVLLGKGEIAYSPLQAGPYNNPNIEKYTYSPTTTERILQENGWSKGNDGIYQKKGQRLEFAIHCSEGDQVRIDMATICAQQLREVGADVSVKVDSKTDWAGQEAYLIGWGSPFDPDDHTYKVFGTEKGANYNYYSNSRVDELLQKARETDVESERLAYYQEFQSELAKDLPYTFIAYTDAVYVGKKEIEGISEDTVLGHHGVGIFWNIAEWEIKK